MIKYLIRIDIILKMFIKNINKKTLIAKNAKLCKNAFSKFLGLMFSKGEKALIFTFEKEKINPLHMIFVFHPIDILFLNKNKIIIEIKKNFAPFSFYNPKNKAKYIIELPKNSVKSTRSELGDQIEF